MQLPVYHPIRSPGGRDTRSVDDAPERRVGSARHASHRILLGSGRSGPCLRSARQRPGDRQSGQLDDASRARLAEPGLAPLARGSGRAPHAHPLRRARVRAVGPRRRRRRFTLEALGRATSRRSSTRQASTASRCSASRRARPSRSRTRARHPEPGQPARALRRLRARARAGATPRGARAGRHARLGVIRVGWGQSRTRPSGVCSPRSSSRTGTPEQMAWFDELQRRLRPRRRPPSRISRRRAATSTSSALAAAGCGAHARAARARATRVVPFAEGRLLATLIPGARFVPLESRNHILLADEPAWPAFVAELDGVPRSCPTPPHAVADVADLSAREQRGARRSSPRALSNDEIAARAVPQRPHRRAPPLERLREAPNLREGPARAAAAARYVHEGRSAGERRR